MFGSKYITCCDEKNATSTANANTVALRFYNSNVALKYPSYIGFYTYTAY